MHDIGGRRICVDIPVDVERIDTLLQEHKDPEIVRMATMGPEGCK
jgi:hypothetical protein